MQRGKLCAEVDSVIPASDSPLLPLGPDHGTRKPIVTGRGTPQGIPMRYSSRAGAVGPDRTVRLRNQPRRIVKGDTHFRHVARTSSPIFRTLEHEPPCRLGADATACDTDILPRGSRRLDPARPQTNAPGGASWMPGQKTIEESPDPRRHTGCMNSRGPTCALPGLAIPPTQPPTDSVPPPLPALQSQTVADTLAASHKW